MANKKRKNLVLVLLTLFASMVMMTGFASCNKSNSASTSSGGNTATESENSKQAAKAAAKGLSWTTLSAEKTGFLKLEEAKDIYGVAYGNGKCVAIGDSQIMSISTDSGKTWQAKTVKTPKWSSSADVLYGNGFFVITSSNGDYFAAEDNLEDWEKVESPGSSLVWLFGDGIFCLVEMFGDEVFFADTPRGSWKKGAVLPEEFRGIGHGIYADGKFVLESSSGIAFTDSPSNKWTYLDAKMIGLSLPGGVGGGIAYADGYMFFLNYSGSLYYASNLSENYGDWKKIELEGTVFYSMAGGNGTLCCLKGEIDGSALKLQVMMCKVGGAWRGAKLGDHSPFSLNAGVVYAGDKFLVWDDKGKIAYSSSLEEDS
jgi:hypothetical protein